MHVFSADVFLKFLLMTVGGDLRLQSVRYEFGDETSDAVLELVILGGVDERIDAAVGEHQYHGEVIEPASKVDRVAGGIQEEDDLVG